MTTEDLSEAHELLVITQNEYTEEWTARCTCGESASSTDQARVINEMMGHAFEEGYIRGKGYLAAEVNRILNMNGIQLS